MFFLGVIYLIATGLFWVLLGAIVGAVERRGLSTALLMLLLASGMVAIGGCVVAVLPASPLPPRQYALAAASLFCAGFFDYMLFLTMGRAMRNGPNGIVWTVAQSGVIFPFLFGVFFYFVPVTWVRGVGMAAVLAALVCNGLAKGLGETPDSDSGAGSWRFWMFLAFLAAGGNQVFTNWPSYYEGIRDGFSAYSRTFWLYMGYLAGFVLSENRRLLRRDYWRQLHDRRLWGFAALWIVGTLVVSFWLSFRGMDLVTAHGLGAICYPVMVCSCLVGFPIYSTLVLRERCTALQWAALITGVAGIVMISVE
ncbi:MAG: hypothetical protein J5654_00675 [Victivallales bacterium]|nr:hypothetical protein [Victivallales bacterium]